MNSSGSILLFNNFFISNKNTGDISEIYPGSTVYFDSASNVSVDRSTFINNIGNIGACIYYLETQRNFFLVLKSNIFQFNQAQISGGAIYYSQIDENIIETPYDSNQFINNTAGAYGDNLASPPMKLKFIENISNLTIKENNVINLIPGITQFNIVVNITDFYNQTISNLNSGFECFLLLKNWTNEENQYIESNFTGISIQGSTSFVAKNGKNKKINYWYGRYLKIKRALLKNFIASL